MRQLSILKTCPGCSVELTRAGFTFHSKRNDRLSVWCRGCMKAYNAANSDRIKTRAKAFYAKNRDAIRAKHKAAGYERAFRERKKVTDPGYATRKYNRYLQGHRDKVRAQKRAYARMKLATDPAFKIAMHFRCRIVSALRLRLGRSVTGAKGGSAIRDLGCTIPELMTYLEAKFQPGMTWDNWSREGWHMDHITPLAAFDLTDPEQFRQAVHYTNIQPLWAADNHSKSDRLDWQERKAA